jgi:CheY-like chemotaxis protein
MPAFLYIEDDLLSREIMQLLLVGILGFKQFIVFEDSTNIEEKLNQLPWIPDVIFVDIYMEPLSGFETLDIIRRRSEFALSRVIALTASVMNEEVQLLKKSGFNGAIAKPIDSDSFPDVLQRIMKGEEIWRIVA